MIVAGGRRYRVVGEHGRPPKITPVSAAQHNSRTLGNAQVEQVDWRDEWRRRNREVQETKQNNRRGLS